MPATKATKTTKGTGKTKAAPTQVGKGSVTKDLACSQAMSKWKSAGKGASMPPDVAAILGKCRAKAHAMKKGTVYRQAGQEAKAQVYEHRAGQAMEGRAEKASRHELAKKASEIRQQRIKERSSRKAREVKESAASHRAMKGMAGERKLEIAARLRERAKKLRAGSESQRTRAGTYEQRVSRLKGGPSLREQAKSHRIGKGTREERIAKIRKRGSEIGEKIIGRFREDVKAGRYHRGTHVKHESRLGALRGRVRVAAGLEGGRGTTKIRNVGIKLADKTPHHRVSNHSKQTYADKSRKLSRPIPLERGTIARPGKAVTSRRENIREFGSRVNEAARAIPAGHAGRSGHSHALVKHVHKEYNKQAMKQGRPGMKIDEFKRTLTKAHKHGHVKMTSAFAGGGSRPMSESDIRESETEHHGGKSPLHAIQHRGKVKTGALGAMQKSKGVRLGARLKALRRAIGR